MATKAQQRRFAQTSNDHQRIIVANLQTVAQRYGMARVFADFIEISAIALARLDRAQFDVREARYLQIIKHYQPDELDLLVRSFSHLVMAFETHFIKNEHGQVKHIEFSDTLGSIYMMLDLGNAGAGQFFTPYDVSSLMAKMNAGRAQAIVEKHGFVRLYEPAVGAGGMVIATAQSLSEIGLSYQKCMHATAIDIDARCVHMTFIQLTLLHIPAIVIEGNALAHEVRSVWHTPAHIIGGWNAKLQHRDIQDEVKRLVPTPAKHTQETATAQTLTARPEKGTQCSQLVLF